MFMSVCLQIYNTLFCVLVLYVYNKKLCLDSGSQPGGRGPVKGSHNKSEWSWYDEHDWKAFVPHKRVLSNKLSGLLNNFTKAKTDLIRYWK